jgi:hypothetical protein
VAEARRAAAAMDDLALEAALRDVAAAIAYPSAGPAGSDVASRVRVGVQDLPRPGSRRGLSAPWLGGRRVRRSVLVAIAALLVLAAVAGAVGLGVPGIRIFFGGATPSPSPSASPIGSPATSPSASSSTGPALVGQSMGLGTAVSLDEAAQLAGLDLVLPPDPRIGPPDAAYVFANRVALVWSARPGLAVDPSTGVGLLLNEFRGSVDEGYYAKQLDSDATVTPVTVGGTPGYWISGAPHFFFYVDPNGKAVDDTHRIVGDTLIWTVGDVTYRLESQLGMQAAIDLAESLR